MKTLYISVLAGLTLAACGANTETRADVKTDVTKIAAPKTIIDVARDLPSPAEGLKTVSIGHNLYVIFGSGGNVGVSVGDDGVLLIDDKYAKNGAAILSQIKGLSDAPLRYVLNTHYHGDHTGSNALMAAEGATLVAQENVPKRMAMTYENKFWGSTQKAVDATLWPSETFSASKTMMFNGHTMNILHTPSAHTDGDSIIHFVEANIVHMGDNFFNGLFPYIDVEGGGSVKGMIAAHDSVLAFIDAETKVIPGHGPMSDKAGLQAGRDMLNTIHQRVSARIKAGDSLEQILAANILQDYAQYASFIDEKKMVRLAHQSILAN